jgi:hypothetical protein
MAEDGYGRAEARGQANGKTKTVSTGKYPISAEVPSFQLTEGGIVEGLMDKFSDLLARMTSE